MGKKEEIAEKLKLARINSKKTQKEVADILGMTYQAISNYERGKTKVESDILLRLCEIYKISISDILSDGQKEKITPKLKSIPKKEDCRLQKITECYNGMTEQGKDFLAAQAEICYKQFAKSQTNERAM